ncbi:hypothetical protein Y032_0094g2731 [Ancylostoma ceylanicum]|uniref:Uncharacterized protein n=1 Tax=Ancylostoma ceylanicum TaxID=53326 RepID=A0A016TL16_9BILA|nr:hypothetical protein Y032_0094g2731 [Ancylostoma ceylanicum]
MPSQLLQTPATQFCTGVPAHVRFRTPSPASGRATASLERSPSLEVDVWRPHPPLKRTFGASQYVMPLVLASKEHDGKNFVRKAVPDRPPVDEESRLDSIQRDGRSNTKGKQNKAKGWVLCLFLDQLPWMYVEFSNSISFLNVDIVRFCFS